MIIMSKLQFFFKEQIEYEIKQFKEIFYNQFQIIPDNFLYNIYIHDKF